MPNSDLTNDDRPRICFTLGDADLNCEDIFHASSNNVTVALEETVRAIDAVAELILNCRGIPYRDYGGLGRPSRRPRGGTT